MAFPSSGAMSGNGWYQELTSNAYTAVAPETVPAVTCSTVLLAQDINQNSAEKPDTANVWNGSGEYQGLASGVVKGFDFYSYDHDAQPSFADSNAVSKGLATGTSHAITLTDSADKFNFTEEEAWTISFWVRAGWSSSLNTNIHFFIGHKLNASYQATDMIKIYYDESNNRLSCRYGNKTTSSNSWYHQCQWLFHSNSGNYAAAYAAAGLGSSYWSASNRGNTGNDNFTMITMTKSTTNGTSGMRMYWNATSLGAAPITTSSGTSGNPAMSATDDRQWSVGSNGKYGSTDHLKTGNSAETVYNDLTIWNKALDQSEITELYNSGARMDVATHSEAEEYLQGYWKFESDGSGADGEGSSVATFSISGDSNIASV